jgi:hypothetical protein
MTSYQWFVSPGGIITSGELTEVVTVSWPGFGEQSISVRYKDSFGMIISSPDFFVRVNTLPENAGQMNGPVRVCQGESGLIYSVDPIPSATDYVWLIPDGSVITSGDHTNTIKLTYTTNAVPGNVGVYGTNMCGDGLVSDFYPVAVNPIPSTPHVTLDGEILHSSAVEGNQWYCNGILVPDANRQDLEPIQNGRYWTVVTLGGCSSANSNKIDYEATLTGLKELDATGFQIYPVPNNGIFTIKLGAMNKTGSKILVYNNMGMIVYENDDVNWDGNSSYLIDLHGLAAGTYAVVVQNDNNHFMKKMLISK